MFNSFSGQSAKSRWRWPRGRWTPDLDIFFCIFPILFQHFFSLTCKYSKKYFKISTIFKTWFLGFYNILFYFLISSIVYFQTFFNIFQKNIFSYFVLKYFSIFFQNFSKSPFLICERIIGTFRNLLTVIIKFPFLRGG